MYAKKFYRCTIGSFFAFDTNSELIRICAFSPDVILCG